MNKQPFELDGIDVASPCSADWDQMQGDDQVRFCRDCKMNVYNLSAMERSEAEELLRSREGRLCVRFYRRSDGKLLTRDCPVGLWAARQRVARMVAGIAAVIGFTVFGGWWTRLGFARTAHSARLPDPLARLVNWIEPPAIAVPPFTTPVTGKMAVMGGCPPPLVAPTPSSTPVASVNISAVSAE